MYTYKILWSIRAANRENNGDNDNDNDDDDSNK